MVRHHTYEIPVAPEHGRRYAITLPFGEFVQVAPSPSLPSAPFDQMTVASVVQRKKPNENAIGPAGSDEVRHQGV
jgi:hypothetical protein